MPVYAISGDEISHLSYGRLADLKKGDRKDFLKLLRENIEVISNDLLLVSDDLDKWNRSEQIDLLAIDQNKNLVVIEVMDAEETEEQELQVVRYGTLISKMNMGKLVSIYKDHLSRTKTGIDAKKSILEHWDMSPSLYKDLATMKLRIILTAREFSASTIATAEWFQTSSLDIRCIELATYEFEDQSIVDIVQLVPELDPAEVAKNLNKKPPAITKKAGVKPELAKAKTPATKLAPVPAKEVSSKPVQAKAPEVASKPASVKANETPNKSESAKPKESVAKTPPPKAQPAAPKPAPVKAKETTTKTESVKPKEPAAKPAPAEAKSTVTKQTPAKATPTATKSTSATDTDAKSKPAPAKTAKPAPTTTATAVSKPASAKSPSTGANTTKSKGTNEVTKPKKSAPLDRAKYIVSLDGKKQPAVAKRRAVLIALSHALKNGVKPDKLPKRIAGTDDILVSVSGNVKGEKFKKLALDERKKVNRSFDAKRYFCQDDELLNLSGRTYAVINQWTLEAFTELMALLSKDFPNLKITYAREVK